MSTKLVFAVVALAVAASAPVTAHIWKYETGYPARFLELPTATFETNAQPMSLGFSFMVQRRLAFGGVAYWDEGRDGLVEAHRVNLYQTAPDGSNQLLSWATVGPGRNGSYAYCQGLQTGCWQFVRAPGWALMPGVTYTIAGFSPGSADAWPLDSEPGGLFGIVVPTGVARYAYGSMNDDPSLPPWEQTRFESLAAYSAMAVNFAIVPEPASWALLIAGFGITGTALRRSRRRGMPDQA